MSLFDAPVKTLGGDLVDLHQYEGRPVLIVNVASQCGLTPQYAGLQRLYDTYKDQGLDVLGFPCNQFGGQEPGTADEIRSFCSANYGVGFSMFDKIDVNGEARHPLYQELTQVADDQGHKGDIRWNFEKFLVAPDGAVTRFAPTVEPEDPALVSAVEAALAG